MREVRRALETVNGNADAGTVTTERTSTVQPGQLTSLHGVAIYARIVREHDQWYAEAVDYQVVGVGSTRRDALASLRRSMRAYLQAVDAQGGDVRRAHRRRARWRSLEVRALTLVGRIAPRGYTPALRILL